MPPASSHKKLTMGQIATLKRWVAEGAKYEVQEILNPGQAVPGSTGQAFTLHQGPHPNDRNFRAPPARKGYVS